MWGMKFFSDEFIEEENKFWREVILPSLQDLTRHLTSEEKAQVFHDLENDMYQSVHEATSRLQDWADSFKQVPIPESFREADAPASPPDHS